MADVGGPAARLGGPESRRHPRLRLGLLLAVAPWIGCDRGGGDSPTVPRAPTEICDGYASWETSEYVLPYPVGQSYVVSQGNCSAGGHSGWGRYAYDFWMPVGTLVTAARAGDVEAVVERYQDGDHAPNHANLVRVLHDDGTYAVYGHLTGRGALVEEGDRVAPGTRIGLSGNTGATGGKPHLHFDVAPCPVIASAACATLPVTFRNADPNPSGLEFGQAYLALPYP